MITGLYVIIPAKNEQKDILKVIKNYKNLGKIIVVDDNSTDNTNFIIKKKVYKILHNKKSLGYDRSIKRGIIYIKKKAKFILTIDGDNQHPKVNLKKIINENMKNYDLIIFNRNKLQRFSEYVIDIISKVLFGIRDPASGMKLYKVNNLKKHKLELNNDQVGMFFFKVYKKKKILNIPIKTKKEKKTIFGNGLKINFKIFNAFIKCI